MENIQFLIVTKDGEEIACNVESANVFEAAEEILQSIRCGDIKVNAEDVVKIVDIPG